MLVNKKIEAILRRHSILDTGSRDIISAIICGLKFPRQAAFTIVELAIGLVIVGLLTGGVLMGQSLIRASEIRSIVTQKEATVAAVYSFKDKFNGIPGDLRNAQSIWGAAADCVTAQTTTATCNGNGNGYIDNQTPVGGIGDELFLFWKHLANADLMLGKFIGVTDGTNTYSVTSNNSLSGKQNNSLWIIWHYGVIGPGIITGNAWTFDGAYGNQLQYGGYAINHDPSTTILTPAEVYALDSKYDDGKPGTGNIRVRVIASCSVKADGITAATNTDTNTAIYNTAQAGNQCVLIFPNVF